MALINRAVVEIFMLPGVEVRGVSRPFFSEAWGFKSDHRFSNVGVMLATTLPPFRLLDALQEIERRLSGATPHRNSDGSYRDRLLDIDIITYADIKMTSERLTLPHPRMRQRDFVMVPLLQLIHHQFQACPMAPPSDPQHDSPPCQPGIHLSQKEAPK